MKQTFSSKALEVNLEATRSEQIHIPPHHQQFIQLSQSHWGIQQRAEEFFREYHHPFSNREVVIEQLRLIALGDLWLYSSVEQPEKAYRVLIDIFRTLFSENIKTELKEQLLQTLLEFMGSLAALNPPPLTSLRQCFDIVQNVFEKDEIVVLRNSRYFKSYLKEAAALPELQTPIVSLTREVLTRGILFWKKNSKIEQWVEKGKALFQPRSKEKLKQIGAAFWSALEKQVREATQWEELLSVPASDDIANRLRQFVNELETPLEKIYVIFYLLHHPGMAHLEDNLLWDLNRLLRNVHTQLSNQDIIPFLERLMELFGELKSEHTATVLDCILTLGKEVIDTNDQAIIEYYEQKLIELGFEHPGKIEYTEDWQIRVNPNHIKNIRVWLELIEYAPYRMRKLLSALIVHLRVGGIFISDTDLFQRDVTQLLNADIQPLYKQIKQLARIFPVYFREIGAEGQLREVTTAIDELSHRQDKLIHFLRKQTHTESNNTHIDLTRSILSFWFSGDITVLEKFVPRNVLNTIDPESKWFTRVHELVLKLCHRLDCTTEGLLTYPESGLKAQLAQIKSVEDKDSKRFLFLIKIYNLLKEKYSFESHDIVASLKKYRFFSEREIKRLSRHLNHHDLEASLKIIYQFMEKLNAIILDPEASEGWENIYHKRHIAVGIPSMYGTYHERKFEALGLTFRLERVASSLIEQLIDTINLNYISAKTLRRIYHVMELFQTGLELDGIYNEGFNSNLKMFKYSLTSASFSLDQYVNIFQFMALSVREIINEYFFRVYDHPLKVIIPQIQQRTRKLSEAKLKEVLHQKSEEFYRDVLSSAFLIQTLDNFISRIINTLRGMVDNFSKEMIHNVMTYDPDLIISPLYKETPKMDNQIFLGAKAYYLKKLYHYHIPTPPGFVLTTELFRHKEVMLNHPRIDEEINRMIHYHLSQLEKMSGLEYGNPRKPLLLSVRAGTAISMPGAMNTFLNVGMNDEIVNTLSQQPNFGWTSWDCYRRFLQSWGMASGIERDVFDQIMIDFKTKFGVEQKIQFTPEQMKKIAYAYKQVLQDNRITLVEDPFLQLRQAILAVMDSWSSERAQVYRKHLQIADEWGTGVIVQQMVLGNINTRSGTGVVFTYDPHRKKPGINLYGEFTLCSQGEDIVAGLVHALPVTEFHREKLYPNIDISLEKNFPRLYQRLLELCSKLIEYHGFSHQEIEFTFESDRAEDLYILQTRAQNIQEHKKQYVFKTSPEKLELVGRGIGVGGGALNGILAFDMDDLMQFKQKYPGQRLILVRPDTVPDDIGMIFQCDGLLTARGGATSHAAVTAARLGKVCIVGCKQLSVNEKEKTCTIQQVLFKAGDKIAIDGYLGNIYKGHYPTQMVEMNHQI